VDKNNGQMRAATETYILIDGDHLSICKFQSDEEDALLPVCDSIKRLVTGRPRD
jgi:hypothetical protein